MQKEWRSATKKIAHGIKLQNVHWEDIFLVEQTTLDFERKWHTRKGNKWEGIMLEKSKK
jgi:hypothetical protein